MGEGGWRGRRGTASDDGSAGHHRVRTWTKVGGLCWGCRLVGVQDVWIDAAASAQVWSLALPHCPVAHLMPQPPPLM